MLDYRNFDYITCAAIFLFALLLRLIFAISEDSFVGLLAEDPKDYFDHLINLSNTGVFFAENSFSMPVFTSRDPGLVFFLYIFSFGTASQIWSISILLFISSITCVLVGKIIFQLTASHKMAIAGAIFMSLYPPSIFFASRILTETIAAFFVVVSFWVYISYSNNRRSALLLLGAVCGFAVLTRSNLLGLPLIYIFHILFSYFLKRKGLFLTLKKIFLIGLGFIVILSPWVIRNANIYDELVLVNSRLGYGLYLTNNDPGSSLIKSGGYKRFQLTEDEVTAFKSLNEVEQDKIFKQKFFESIKGKLHQYPEIIKNRIINYWHFKPNPYKTAYGIKDFVSFFFWIPIILSFVTSFFFMKNSQIQLILLISLYGIISILPFYGYPRFRFPYDPLILVSGFIIIHELKVKWPLYSLKK